MQLNLQTVQQMLATAAAAAQAACAQLLDLSIGSPARAILSASSALWDVQQANVYRLLKVSRLATSSGPDVDSFILDWGGPSREPATYANGAVTLARFSPTASTTVPVGATVRTGDGSQTYGITADPTNACWSASVVPSGGYVLPAGVASVTVPIQALTAGSAGNIIVGAISLTGTDMPGVDTVTNAAAIVDGADQESDAAYKIRFVGYIASLSKATVAACLAAVSSVQQGLSCTLRENSDEQGNFLPGHFVVTVDDGSGSPPPSLLSAVYAAVDLVRAATVTFSVQPPSVVHVSVELTITVGAGGVKINLVGPVGSAVTSYINALASGGTLSMTRIAAAAYGVDPTITNVSGIVVNVIGGAAATYTTDFVLPAATVVKAAAVTVS